MGAYPQPVFLDTTVLSNFASTDSIPVLVEAVDSPCVTEAVQEEIEQGVAFGHAYLENAVAAFEGGLPVKSLQREVETHHLRNRLDAGETASLIGALENEGTLATDDLAARRFAEENGIPVTGSVGILVLAVDIGVIDVTTGNQWLDIWRDVRGYYAPVDRLEPLLEGDS